MKKKVVALTLGLAMTATVLGGCSSKEKETEKETQAKTEAQVQTEKETPAPATEAETLAVVEAATEAVTEAATEAKTEAVTEAAEVATEAVTEEATEAVTEAATEAPTEEATEAVTEAATEAPTEEATEVVTEAKTEAATEAATEVVTEAVTEATEEVTEAVTDAVEEAVAAMVAKPGDTFKVGVVKFMDHASLNQIEDSLDARLDELAEETGVNFDYENYTFNGNGDGTTLNQIGAELVSDEVDVIVAIATPAAQIMQSVAEDTDIPVIFSAVTDPVGAKLVESMEEPGGNITGTSDALNTETMMQLMLANDLSLKKVGLLYSKSEDSSTQPIAEAKELLAMFGVDTVEKTGTTTDEINQAVDALIEEGVGAIFTPTDNTVMNAELSFYEKLAEAGIPHYAGADSFALNGAFCGFGINYEDLGTATADMVCNILAYGADPATTPVETFDSGIATINTETAEAIGMDMDDIEDAIGPHCSAVVETKTAQNFSDIDEEAATE